MPKKVLPAAVATLVLASGVAFANPVVDWNAIAVRSMLAAGQGPLPQSRTMTIVSVAVHDAVTAITRVYEPFARAAAAPREGSAEAAAIAAAHHALVALLPSQSAALDADYATALAQYGIGSSDPGLVVGVEAAQRILDLRTGDGSSLAQFPYTPPGAGIPGVWVPTPPAFAPALAPGWGNIVTWVIEEGTQFRPEVGAPDLSSRRFARDFQEVKALGSVNSAIRTAEQTAIARFWIAAAPTIWNNVLRRIAVAKALDIADSARAFAVMNLAGADAAIVCWDAKYHFNTWRPVTAIRQADTIGNPRLVADPTWEPLIPTPPFPEFPSGHAVISSAMAWSLGKMFGDVPGVPVIAESPTNAGFVRTWEAFTDGIAEVIEARIYSGIHFRTADERGAAIGKKVGLYVARRALLQRRPDKN
jgi:membrane-associated phospholipid phosphatase